MALHVGPEKDYTVKVLLQYVNIKSWEIPSEGMHRVPVVVKADARENVYM